MWPLSVGAAAMAMVSPEMAKAMNDSAFTAERQFHPGNELAIRMATDNRFKDYGWKAGGHIGL